MTQYKLSPFKSKRKKGINKKSNVFEELRVTNNRKDINMSKRVDYIGFRGGYPFIFGFLKDTSDFKLPYFSLFYGIGLNEANSLFLELEVGYLSYDSKDQYSSQDIVEHAFPSTLSLVYDLKLTNWFFIRPKLGAGYMFFYTTYSTTLTSASSQVSNTALLNSDSKLSGAIILRPALALSFMVANDIFITLEGSFIVSQDLKGSDSLDDLDYYLIPSLGMSFRF